MPIPLILREIPMTLMDDCRNAIKKGTLPPIFKKTDLEKAGISDKNDNLSNYDKKNSGAKNKKVLVSEVINSETYYTFDEQLFP